jgi:hypothetical protein
VEAELVEHAEEMPMTDNPATAHPQPPQHEQQQSPPGETRVMTPTPDHGEESYRGSGKLAGKTALITGADSGIGRAVAIAFAREGADMVISYLEEHDDARETARWVEQAGRLAILIDGDVSKDDHCRMLVKRTVGELGKIDILVNNAAMQRTHESIEGISSEEWDVPDQHLLDVLPLQGVDPSHVGRQRDRQHRIDQLEKPLTQPAGLCDDEGR